MKKVLIECSKLIPDKLYIKILYFLRMKKRVNFKQPKTFNEKIQWLKLYDRNPKYTILVDKYAVKEYVAKIIGEEYIVKTLGVWNEFDDIDFESLPNQFVLKCTHDSGGLIICKDKSKLDIDNARKKIEECLRTNFYWHGREWPYKNVAPKIIAEEYLEMDGCLGLRDYKFFCFNGKPSFLYVSEGLENHETAQISFFDFEGKKLEFERSDFLGFETDIVLPSNFKDLLVIAKVLAQEVNDTFSRIDLYSVNNKIYFSEITFHPCSVFLPFEPSKWDDILGEQISLERVGDNE